MSSRPPNNNSVQYFILLDTSNILVEILTSNAITNNNAQDLINNTLGENVNNNVNNIFNNVASEDFNTIANQEFN